MKTLFAQVSHGRVELKEKELPAPGEGQLLLKAQYSTISPGTEHTLMNGLIVPLPTSIGYSMCATVEALGPGVEEFEVGDVVVTTGEHAQYLVMEALNCTPAPRDVDREQAAFWNLGHTGLYAVRQSRLQLGEPAVVMGQGFVGAMTAQFARLAGALPVIVTDLSNERLEMARRMGVHRAINPREDPDALQREVDKLNRGGVPVVFEATGSRQPLEQAFDLVAERGRVVMISQVYGEAPPQYDQKLMMKGASLIGSYVNSRPFALRRADLGIAGTWPPVLEPRLRRFASFDGNTSDEDIRVFLDLLYYGSLGIRPLITHRFDYREIPAAYEEVWNQNPALVGGVIRWDG